MKCWDIQAIRLELWPKSQSILISLVHIPEFLQKCLEVFGTIKLMIALLQCTSDKEGGFSEHLATTCSIPNGGLAT
jgi:hypothetical protein